MMVVPIAGYFQIPIEQTVIACADNPDSRVVDVLEQQRSSSGTEGNGG
jgi:hypothetical protein